MKSADMEDMDNAEEKILAELQSIFTIEAEEHVQALSAGLLELEKTPPAEHAAIAEKLCREAHSLKGAARAVDLNNVEEICQALESVLALVKRGKLSLTSTELDLLHGGLDLITRLVSSLGEEHGDHNGGRVAGLVCSLYNLAAEDNQAAAFSEGFATETPSGVAASPSEGRSAAAAETRSPETEEQEVAAEAAPAPMQPAVRQAARPASVKSGPSETIRVSTAKLDSLLLKAEEMLSVKLTVGQCAADLQDVVNTFSVWRKEWGRVDPKAQAVRRSLGSGGNGNGRAQTRYAARLPDFLDWNCAHFQSTESRLKTLQKSLEGDIRSIAVTVDGLLEDAKKVLMLPCSSLLQTFPKMVRDIAREQGKEVDLELLGESVEIDRRILEEIKDPLIHLVRNCIDHGIEKPQQREESGKPSCGKVTVTVSEVRGDKVEILVSDDGTGIDVEKVKRTGIKQGLLSEADSEDLDKQQLLWLVFKSGLSTSPVITDISGRGLGLAIVQEKVNKLGGQIAVETEPGAGTKVRILLPLTLATFRGILIECAGRLFVIPTASVKRAVRIKNDEIKTIENRETISLNGEALSLARLSDILGLPSTEKPAETRDNLTILVLAAAGKQIAFAVDQLLQEQEILVKGLGKQLARVRNIAGATILGSGTVVPVLNVGDLIKSAEQHAGTPATTKSEEVKTRTKSILVVDDSITSRTLLKNILELAGYDVQTFIDGVAAFTALKTEPFDLAVVDIQMPRMDGFELTTAIRDDEKLKELPVVLVTALSDQENRERGIDVGANAYIVKSDFDQSNLLETVERLL
jgi:two-component system chemotaxis sensor kinase CheA